MQRTKNFTQTSGSHTAQRNRWSEGIGFWQFHQTIYKTSSSQLNDHRLWVVSFALELAFCLKSSLDLYYSVSLSSSSGWRAPIYRSDKKCSVRKKLNASVAFRGFLVLILSISHSFVKLSGPSTIVKHISFSPWVHLCLYSFCWLHLKLLFPSSCSGSLRLHFKFYLLSENFIVPCSFSEYI